MHTDGSRPQAIIEGVGSRGTILLCCLEVQVDVL